MTLSPPLRKLALLAHVATSVGFLGAVTVFLALAIAGLLAPVPQRARAAYLATDMTTWAVIVPLCFASLLTRLIVSLGTTWGLVRHYWILIKLLIMVAVTIILTIHTVAVSRMSDVAVAMDLTGRDLVGARVQLIVASGAAVLALLATTALSIYEPRGMTRFSWRKRYQEDTQARS